MGFKKISELDPAALVNDSDLFAGVQEYNNKKYTAEQLKLYFQDGTQPELTFDDAPVENSNNPVKSGGLYSEFATKQDVLTFDAMPIDGSSNPVTSDGIEEAIAASEARSIPLSQKGEAGGVAELDSSGKVLSSQLPSYVDDVEEYLTRSNFPVFGEGGKIYIALDTNLAYRWTGSGYAEISPSLALGETSSTAYRGDRGKTAYDFSQSPYTSAPAMDGAASAGSSSSWARGDHVHPKDASKQDVLTFDNTPTENSSNPVKSGGVYSAIQDAISTLDGYVPDTRTINDKALSEDIELDYSDVGAISDEELSVNKETVSGAIASFESSYEQSLESVVVNIEPIQSGSGDPSPTNVRPISGWTGMKLANGRAFPDLTAYDVLDFDYDTPVDPSVPHTMTLASKNCLENILFDEPEALIYCPDGLSAGTRYYITADHAAYNSGTTQDGNYGFTPTQAVPAGGYVRHSVLGVYRSDSTYTKAQVLAGKFITYGTDFAQIEQLTTDEGTEGTYLGKTTAADPTYLDPSYPNVNFSQRNGHGSNEWETSNLRQYLNSVGTGWWTKKTKWSFPPANVDTLQGFLTGIDPALRENMQTVKKRVATSVADRPGGTPLYKDVEDKVFLLSMTEVNLGTNNYQYETSYGLDNTLKTVPYAYYKDAANTDRIKLLNGSPSTWWLRGPYPTHADRVRLVLADGSLSYHRANSRYGLVVAFAVGIDSLTEISWQSEAGTVYGGTLDVTTGVLTVDRAIIDPATENINKNSQSESNYLYYILLPATPSSLLTDLSRPADVLCSAAPTVVSAPSTTPGVMLSVSNNRIIYISLGVLETNTVDGFKAACSANNVRVVYPIATPTTYQLTPTEVKALLGQNNIWADTGDTTVTYRDNTIALLSDIADIDAKKQNVLTFDDAPTASSSNPVTSDGLYSEFAAKQDVLTFDSFFSILDNICPPEIHRQIFRGKNLGTSLTAEQKAEISAGTFKDLWLGDYWVINGVTWRIADFDYWYRCGDTEFTRHHLVIMPDTILYNAKMNATNTTAGGYYGSAMRGVEVEGVFTPYAEGCGLYDALTAFQNAFGDALLTHRDHLVNAVTDGVSSGGAWVNSIIELPSEIMVYGTGIRTPTPSWYTAGKSQLALMQASPKFINIRATYWLRDVASATDYAFVFLNGAAISLGASNSYGVRPVGAIG